MRYGLPLYCPIQLDPIKDPLPGCIEKLRVVFNDCLRLLCRKKRSDQKSISKMLDELGWLSLNQLAAETRLVGAWNLMASYLLLSNINGSKMQLNNATELWHSIVFRMFFQPWYYPLVYLEDLCIENANDRGNNNAVAIFVSYTLCHTLKFSKRITPTFCVIHF